MSRELTPQELVLLQKDTDYLNAGIPVFGSRVVIWATANNMPVLIYHTNGYGYIATDLSDLGQATIDQLAKQSEVHGFWYYLIPSMQEVITERAQQTIALGENIGASVAEITRTVAETTGKTLADLISPLVDALLVPLVIVGVVLGIYLFKKG